MLLCESWRIIPVREYVFETASLTSLMVDVSWSGLGSWICSLSVLLLFRASFLNCSCVGLFYQVCLLALMWMLIIFISSRCGLIHWESFFPSLLLVISQFVVVVLQSCQLFLSQGLHVFPLLRSLHLVQGLWYSLGHKLANFSYFDPIFNKITLLFGGTSQFVSSWWGLTPNHSIRTWGSWTVYWWKPTEAHGSGLPELNCACIHLSAPLFPLPYLTNIVSL